MTREEAIKELKEELKELVTWLVIHRHDKEICEPKERRKRAIEMAIIALEQRRWIPCSERLPERDVNVLTYHRDVAFDYQYVSWIDDYSGKWAGFIGNLSDEVLAWMPLPEDYKEGSK